VTESVQLLTKAMQINKDQLHQNKLKRCTQASMYLKMLESLLIVKLQMNKILIIKLKINIKHNL